MNANNNWRRVSKRRPCPICNRADWCLFAGPADSPAAAICPRVESAKRCGEAGWLHILRDDGPTLTPWRRTIRRAIKMMAKRTGTTPDFGKLAAEFRAAARPEALRRLGYSLGVSVEGLQRLGVGWSVEHRAWTFPMVDADGTVLGIRLRLRSGKKLSVRGRKEGLFVPDGRFVAWKVWYGKLLVENGN